MALANKRGQITRYRNLRHRQTQARMNQFEVYLEANPIFTAELVTQPPAGALMLPMSYELEGLYRYPLGQGVVYLDPWQLQPRTVQSSAHKAPPFQRRKADEYTTLIVQSMMKEKPMITGLVDEHDRQAEQHDKDVLGAEIEKQKRQGDFWYLAARSYEAQAKREAAEKRVVIAELAEALTRIDVLQRKQTISA